jgi:maltose alpha-D-glucosyltransferase/alpha-amylase
VNVEAQQRNGASLLHWTRRMIDVRKRHPAFGMGTFTELGGSNPSVLAFVRHFGDDVVLCVNNLSRFPQPVELDLHRYTGSTPVELVGGVHFPRIGDMTYLLTLPGHGCFWFRITTFEEGA